MHMNAVWQNLYVCANKNFCALSTFEQKILHPWYSLFEVNALAAISKLINLVKANVKGISLNWQI